MRRIVVTATVAAAFALTASAPARADVLTLKTGASERGVILRETPEGYWVQIGAQMKLFYSHGEVTAVERESDEVHERLAARWEREAATMTRPGPTAARRSRGEEADDAASADGAEGESDLVPKEERYDYIKGGAFEPGVAAQRDVVDKLGDPDTVKEVRPGVVIYQYETRDGDAYALQFERDEQGREVLKESWFVSDAAERAKQERKKSHHQW